jgi:hypothetical protein
LVQFSGNFHAVVQIEEALVKRSQPREKKKAWGWGLKVVEQEGTT